MGTILIVDDDAQLRTSFEKLLTTEGHTVKTAPTGEGGLELAKANLPDLVIMDVRLPGMDGLAAFQAIHEIEPKLPVIIMTAYGTTDTAIKATKLGAFDYVLKPFDIPEMLSLIDKALEAGRFMRSRVEVDAFGDERSPDRDTWPKQGHARGLQSYWSSRSHRCYGIDSRRVGHGKRTRRQSHLPA